MANQFSLTNVVVQGMLNATPLKTSIDAGTAAVIEIYNGTMPTNADATESNTLLASLTCSHPAFASVAASGNTALATFSSITPCSSAAATGTASHFRIKTQTGGTVIAQGTVGTATSDLVLNTVSITSGSTVSITSATLTLPVGP